LNINEILWLLPLSITLVAYGIYGVLALALGKGERSVARKDKNYTPYISVIVPSYNEESIINGKLENTLETTYPREKMEIIVVDSSTDKTPEIVADYVRRYPFIKLIHEKQRTGIANALNKAYALATGEVVVRTDTDSLLNKNSIPEIVANFSDPDIGAVTTKLSVLNKEKRELKYRSIQQRVQMAESKLDSTYIIQPFSAFKRDLIKPINAKSVADDGEVGLNIRKQGYRVIYDPTAEYYEASPKNFVERVRLKSRRAHGHIKLLLSNVRLCFNPNFSKYGLVVFPMNFFMIIIAPLMTILIPTLFILDLLTSRSFLILDIVGLFALCCITLLRNTRFLSSVWAIVELQYAQLIALKNVIIGLDQHMWVKDENLREYYVRG
jgi:cellulose synthase/poly-beta-1,6-N-acetylglucosamine synthase-like glycosyltransferase